jgi:hypothetical protein
MAIHGILVEHQPWSALPDNPDNGKPSLGRIGQLGITKVKSLAQAKAEDLRCLSYLALPLGRRPTGRHLAPRQINNPNLIALANQLSQQAACV